MAVLPSQDELWIIDVSQSVDLDHPRAFDFLREDALHVNDFFRRAGVATLTVRELFDFVVDPNINAGNIEAAVDALIKVASSRPAVQDPEVAMAEKVCDPWTFERLIGDKGLFSMEFACRPGGLSSYEAEGIV